MIDFACKQFVIDDIVKCSLGLTKGDLRIFRYLATHKDAFTTEQLASSLRLDLSTVQRAVKKLHEQDVVLRHQENLNGGGYLFRYSVVSQEFLRKKIMAILHAWIGKVDDALLRWP